MGNTSLSFGREGKWAEPITNSHKDFNPVVYCDSKTENMMQMKGDDLVTDAGQGNEHDLVAQRLPAHPHGSSNVATILCLWPRSLMSSQVPPQGWAV